MVLLPKDSENAARVLFADTIIQFAAISDNRLGGIIQSARAASGNFQNRPGTAFNQCKHDD